ncbi:PD-(D/E)XK nuclease family protein [Chloroflexota bacterium]
MAIKRQSPYIWVTWLTRLIVGDYSCEWGAWFRTQHENNSWDKVPSSFDQTAWLLQHAELVRKVQSELEETGRPVFIENQNHFALRGSVATLGGKPDIISTLDGKGIIIDAKTGKPNPYHHVQVMVYMYAVPLSLRQYLGMSFDGKVVYQDHDINIPHSAVDDNFIENMSNLIKRLASTTPARKVPNIVECGFCDITPTDCQERITSNSSEAGETFDF